MHLFDRKKGILRPKSGLVFKLTAYSAWFRPPIPGEAGHPFRLIPATKLRCWLSWITDWAADQPTDWRKVWLNLFGGEPLGWLFQRFTQKNNGLLNKLDLVKALINIWHLCLIILWMSDNAQVGSIKNFSSNALSQPQACSTKEK